MSGPVYPSRDRSMDGKSYDPPKLSKDVGAYLSMRDFTPAVYEGLYRHRAVGFDQDGYFVRFNGMRVPIGPGPLKKVVPVE